MMNGFMMYMSGAGIHIFSIMITFMGIMNPAKAILGVHGGELNYPSDKRHGRNGTFWTFSFDFLLCATSRSAEEENVLLQDGVVRCWVTQRVNGADLGLELPHSLPKDLPSAFSCVFHRCFFAKAEYSVMTCSHVVSRPTSMNTFAHARRPPPPQPSHPSVRPSAATPHAQYFGQSTTARTRCSCRSSYSAPSTSRVCVSRFGRWPRWACCQ